MYGLDGCVLFGLRSAGIHRNIFLPYARRIFAFAVFKHEYGFSLLSEDVDFSAAAIALVLI
tara:strand:- start:9546 stop:9728 length:183 start_codon:yes stop_codon:yes gene_type:complete